MPTESSPVLEYWESIDINLNAEAGATIYDGNEFCFGGYIYEKDTIRLHNGNTFIYPKFATRDNVICCNGAVISTYQENKYCENNDWVIIDEETGISCISDFNCPGQGQFTCQNLLLSGWHCGDDNFCVEDTSQNEVECCSQADCPTDQTCQDNTCVGGGVTPPVGDGGDGGDDDELCPGFWEYETEQSEVVGRGPLGIGKLFGLTETITTPVCKTHQWVLYAILGIVIFGLGTVAIFVYKPKKGAKKGSKGRKTASRRKK